MGPGVETLGVPFLSVLEEKSGTVACSEVLLLMVTLDHLER